MTPKTIVEGSGTGVVGTKELTKSNGEAIGELIVSENDTGDPGATVPIVIYGNRSDGETFPDGSDGMATLCQAEGTGLTCDALRNPLGLGTCQVPPSVDVQRPEPA